jgi:formamidopyrimidine-DNA glycosylase
VPELPEVETVVRDLQPLLTGRTLLELRRSKSKLRRPWKPAWDALVTGRRVEAVRRRGKWIVVDLHDNRSLVIHLGMTGQLTVTEAATPEENHTHLVFTLDDGRHLRFRDIRRFGSAAMFKDAIALQSFFDEAMLGPEPWDLDRLDWRRRLKASRRALKAMLLDQRLVAGVGNIYADEALFEARLHPAKTGAALSSVQADRLREAIVTVLERAIERRGATISDFVGGSGLQGRYQQEFRVYSRTGDPCLQCKTPIKRIRLAGRSTHYCPRCQKPSHKPNAQVLR